MKVDMEFQEPGRDPERKKKIQRIIEREAMIIVGLIVIFILGLFINRAEVWLFPFWGYPLYHIVRFFR